jgi:hypothetical protein
MLKLSPPHWRWVLLLPLLLLLPVVGPLLHLEELLFSAAHGVCAQSHQWQRGGVLFPLCIRDSGTYLAAAAQLLLALRRRPLQLQRPSARTIAAAAGVLLLFVADGVNSTVAEYGGPALYPPQDALRLISGLLFGHLIGAVLVAMLVTLLPAAATSARPYPSEHTLMTALFSSLLLGLAMLIDSPFVAWPLAILSMAGLLAVLTIALTLPLAAFSGGFIPPLRPRRLLAATAGGMLLAVIMLSGLSLLRAAAVAHGLMPAPPILP